MHKSLALRGHHMYYRVMRNQALEETYFHLPVKGQVKDD